MQVIAGRGRNIFDYTCITGCNECVKTFRACTFVCMCVCAVAHKSHNRLPASCTVLAAIKVSDQVLLCCRL